jgi:hypothetical protein
MSIKQGGWQLVTGCLLLGIGLPAGVVAQSVDELETRIQGSQENQRLGATVTLSGDVTGDGVADLVVGSPSYTPPEGGQDPVWAVFVYEGGGEQIQGKDPDWTLLGDKPAGDDDQSLRGQFGLTVASLGDQDDDGCEELGVGVAGQDGETGRVFLYDLCDSQNTDPSPYATIEGSQPGDLFGFSLAGNASTLLVGALDHDTGQVSGEEGEGAVFRFNRGSLPEKTDDAAVVYQGAESGSLFGYSVALGPNLVGEDNAKDVFIGAPAHGDGGQAFLFAGGESGSQIGTEQAYLDLVPDQANAGLGVRIAGYDSGNSPLGKGVLVGSSIYAGPNNGKPRQGAVFLFPIDENAIETFGEQEMPPDQAVTFLPDQENAEMGTLAVLPDVDGGESPEILVGAPLFTNSVFQEGAAFLFRGERLEIGQAPLTPDDANAVYFGGEDVAQMGSSLSAGGNVNAQGKGDLVIGARGLDGEVADVGGAFVYPGETIANLSVELVDPPSQGKANNGLEYNFRVTNPVGQAIPQAWVRIPRPADVAHTEDNGGDCIYGEEVIRCEVGALGGNEKATVTARMVPEKEGEIEIQGTLLTEGAIDPDLGDNVTDSVTTEVAAGAVNTEPVTEGSSDDSSGSGCSSGGGGCTLQRSGFFDPTFPILVAFGAFWLLRRRAGWG